MSIIAGVLLTGIFFHVNLSALKEKPPEQIHTEEVVTTESAKRILKEYMNGKYFGKTAKTVGQQMDRIQRTKQRLTLVLGQRFTKDSMSWKRYDNIITAAQDSAIHNVITMVNRMQLFDEREYARLKHYKEDDIPDDIQEKQIALYQKNLEEIRNAINLNEQLLLKLDSLAMELSLKSSVDLEKSNESLLAEIEQLTDEIQYYG